MGPKRFRWWHGLAFFGGVQAVNWALRAAARAATRQSGTRKQDREFYSREKLPVFAPPPAAFPVAWSINSACAIAGGLHVLNLPRGTRGRAEFLKLQGAAWALFASFEAAYFGLRSPMNAAAVTLAYSAVTAASMEVALRRLEDRSAALALAPTAAWLALANPVGLTQAAWNRDSFWNAGPFLKPAPGWVKND